jgi:isoquinoline 1-oxidoreductase subunit beta
MTKMELTRRSFVTTAVAAGGGMILGFHMGGVSKALAASVSADAGVAPADGTEMNIWLTIDTNGIVTARCPYTEMGQGGMTSVAQMVAEELHVPWENIRCVLADAHRNVNEGEPYGTMATGGSNLVRNRHPMIFAAAASARERLKEAAAQAWGVDRSAVTAEAGMLTSGDHSASYGEFATAAAGVSLDEEPEAKPISDWWLAGTSVPRMDVEHKVDGSAIYPIDIRLPDMVYAAVMASPVPGGRLVSFDKDAIMNRPGVIDVVELVQVVDEPGGTDLLSGVAVVADSYYRAATALNLLPVEWDFRGFEENSDEVMNARAEELMGQDGDHVEEVRGDPRPILAEAENVITGDYHRPYEAHATMCPPSAVAHVTADRCDVWSYSQNAGGTLLQAADQSGLDPSQVFYHSTFQGGGFGGGFTTDVARQAVEVSKQVGRPVKVVWSREEDIRQNRSRPPMWGRFMATLGDDGLPTAMIARMVGESMMPAYADRGIANMPYLVPNFRYERQVVPANHQRGPHRAPGNNANAFGLEQFVDEVALAGGWDPLEWRLKMTEGNERWQRVLLKIQEISGWTTDLPDGVGMGIGVVDSHGSVVGIVATVEVTRRGALFIDNILCVVNCGYTLNPRAAGEQIEGSVAWELSHVLNGGIRMRNGQFQNTNFDSYNMLRMPDMPNVEYVYANSESDWWGGIGEPITPPLPPAIANAIYFASGRRIRSTPIIQHDLTPV